MSFARLMLAHFVYTKENQDASIAIEIQSQVPDHQADDLYEFFMDNERLYNSERLYDEAITQFLSIPPPFTLSTFPESPQSPEPSPPLPPQSPPSPPPPPPSLLDSQTTSQIPEEEWLEIASVLDSSDLVPVPYPYRDDWDTFDFPDPSPPPVLLFDLTPSHASIENSLYGAVENLVADELPLTPAVEVPPPPPPPAQRRRITRRAKKEMMRRRAAEEEKARVCHKIFCRLPR